MILLLILSIGLFLGFEIQKLIQFNYFFRMKCLISDYYNNIILRKHGIIQKEVIKLGLINFVYSIVTFIGLFTINKYLFVIIIIQSIFDSIFFRIIKNKKMRKLQFITDTIISMIVLSLISVNLLFFHVDSIEFITIILNNF